MGPKVAACYTAPSPEETLSSVFNSMICKQHAMFNKSGMFKGSGCGTSECVRICNELDWNSCSHFGIINASVRISYKLDRNFCSAPTGFVTSDNTDTTRYGSSQGQSNLGFLPFRRLMLCNQTLFPTLKGLLDTHLS